MPIHCFPFPVYIDKFKPNNTITNKNEVLVYFKRRNPEELEFIKNFLNKKNVNYVVFDYEIGYKEDNYLLFLQHAKYGIIIDAHESQGFAIEEALSCNVPLLVWNVHYMSQEHGSSYNDILCTTIPYWDKKCGETFYTISEFENIYNKFINNITTYEPRKYIVESLSPNQCGEQFLELINNYK